MPNYAYVKGLVAGTQSRNRLAISCNEIRASGRGRGMMRDNTPGGPSVHEKLEARVHISQVEQGAAGRSSVYDPPVVAPFPASGPSQEQDAWQWWTAAPNR